jgi:glycosyltransferase involved in cell wall biosynthesis
LELPAPRETVMKPPGNLRDDLRDQREQTEMNGLCIYQAPSMGLAYFKLLRAALEGAGCTVIQGNRFPRRGIFVGKRIHVLHLHMLDQIFLTGKTRSETIGKVGWFFGCIVPALRSRGIRLVWSCHEWTAHENDPDDVLSRLSLWLCRTADHIIVHSTYMYDILSKRLAHLRNDKLTLMPHGDLRPHFEPALQAHSASVNGGHPEFVFASLGHMRPNKGNDVIIRAFRRLDDPNVRLVMAGVCHNDQYHSKLVDLAAGDSRITLQSAPLSDAELVAGHLQADAVVFGFRDCPTSGSVISAMSLGRPAIAPRTGHVLDLVDHTTGWSFDPGENEEENLLRAMKEASASKEACQERGENAQRRIAQDDWPTIAKQLVAIYRNGR